LFPYSENSKELLLSGFRTGDRVLITGAGGWFGLTLAAMLKDSFVSHKLITKNPRDLFFGYQSSTAEEWSWEEIQKYQPTVVVDCAFLLRDYLVDYSLDSYVAENQKLTSKLFQVSMLDSVERIIYISSGAAVCPNDAVRYPIDENPYGFLKRTTELGILQLSNEHKKNVLVVRPYSVTGRLVTRPERYAFSNLILQAHRGKIELHSRHLVRRKYISVDDLLAVSIASSQNGSGYLNSGGELVELGELAVRISDVLGVTVDIPKREINEDLDDNYFSTDDSWNESCKLLNFSPSSLDEQIIDVSHFLNGN
jgi:nucleoside-diphosphate-sugar epimerase